MSRDLIVLAAAMMTWGVGEGLFLAFEPIYLQQLGADPVRIGAILGAVGLAMAVAHLPAGYLADRFGRRPLLLAAWTLGTLSAWMMALSRSLPWFVAAIILYGLTNFVIVPLNSYVTAARGRLSVGRVITMISALYNLGAVAGPILGGWIGEHYGLHRTFLIGAILFIFSSATVLFIRPQPVERRAGVDGSGGLRSLLTGRYLRYLYVVFIAVLFTYLPQPLSQNFLVNERGVSLAQVGTIVAARSVGIVLLNLVLGQINARRGFLLAQAAVCMATLLLWQGSGLPWFIAGYLLLGGYGTTRSLVVAQGQTLVQPGNMGLGYALIETVASLAIILAPPLAGLLYELNPVWIYSFSAVLIAGSVLNSLVFSPLRTRDMA